MAGSDAVASPPSASSEATATEETGTQQAGSYVDYLKALSKEDAAFTWLYTFFTKYPTGHDLHNDKTRVLVANYQSGKWKLSQSLTHADLEDTANLNGRLIVLQSKTRAGIDRDILDTLAFRYDVSPIYLCHVLEDRTVGRDYDPDDPLLGNAGEPHRCVPITPQLTGLKFLSVYFQPSGSWSMSALVLDDEGEVPIGTCASLLLPSIRIQTPSLLTPQPALLFALDGGPRDLPPEHASLLKNQQYSARKRMLSPASADPIGIFAYRLSKMRLNTDEESHGN
jgi:hypothetical protein